MIATIIMVFVTIVSMYLTFRIAESRGRSTRAWLWLAAVFGPFAALAVWVLPAQRGPDRGGAYRH